MTSSEQQARAAQLRQFHRQAPPLVLPNAWDAASARVFEQAGCRAIATTSSGVAAALGYPDGERISREMLVEATARVTRAVACPVTADIEAGYGASIAEKTATVRAIIEAGAVGINIEDSSPQSGSLVEIADQVELIGALRELAAGLGVPFVINARVDVFLLGTGEPESRVEHAARRANAYLQAGADCAYPIGSLTADVIASLVTAINGPVNILAGPAAPPLAELARLGVARVSFGAGLMRAALGHLRAIARELLDQGSYAGLAASTLTGAEFGALFGD